MAGKGSRKHFRVKRFQIVKGVSKKVIKTGTRISLRLMPVWRLGNNQLATASPFGSAGSRVKGQTHGKACLASCDRGLRVIVLYFVCVTQLQVIALKAL